MTERERNLLGRALGMTQEILFKYESMGWKGDLRGWFDDHAERLWKEIQEIREEVRTLPTIEALPKAKVKIEPTDNPLAFLTSLEHHTPYEQEEEK